MSSPSPPLTRGNRGETAVKNIRRRGFLLLNHDLAAIFYCSAIKNGIPMPSPSPPLTRGNRRETAAKNIRRRGIFIIQIRFGGYFLLRL
jgi:hypothetical protein